MGIEEFSDMVEKPKDFSGVTMQELDEQIRELRDVRNELDQIDEATVKPLKKKRAQLEGWIEACLDEHKKKSYKSCYGDIVVSSRCSVKIPDSTEDKHTFREYLEGRGLFDSMWGIHSGSLNKWYNSYVESCEVKGEIPEPVPGLGEPVVKKTVALKNRR